MHTMTKRQAKSGTIDIKAVLAEDQELLRALVRMALQVVLEAEMTEALGAEKGERAVGRQGYRSGYYGRTLITRVGKLELRVPQDPTGRFSTELFERYQRSERAQPPFREELTNNSIDILANFTLGPVLNYFKVCT
jgi:putative transposase